MALAINIKIKMKSKPNQTNGIEWSRINANNFASPFIGSSRFSSFCVHLCVCVCVSTFLLFVCISFKRFFCSFIPFIHLFIYPFMRSNIHSSLSLSFSLSLCVSTFFTLQSFSDCCSFAHFHTRSSSYEMRL